MIQYNQPFTSLSAGSIEYGVIDMTPKPLNYYPDEDGETIYEVYIFYYLVLRRLRIPNPRRAVDSSAIVAGSGTRAGVVVATIWRSPTPLP